MKECECKEKAMREYEARVKANCSMLDAAGKEECMLAEREILAEALARCTPTPPPSTCEKEADAVYEKKM
jgi:hypothetical protein